MPQLFAIAGKLGLCHFLTEVACAFAVFRAAGTVQRGIAVVLIYNLIAFCGQPLVGWLIDRYQSHRRGAILGELIVAAGVLLCAVDELLGTIVVASGNAIFHVSAGGLTLMGSDHRAADLGLFLGPGAIGLTFGFWIEAHLSSLGLFWVPLFPLVGVVLLQRVPHQTQQWHAEKLDNSGWQLAAIMLVCIGLRSAVGGTIKFDWNDTVQTGLVIGAALAIGKISGGFLADRFGWQLVGVGSVLVAIPCIWAGNYLAAAGFLGTALFQMPAAITLGLLAGRWPKSPGLVFGAASSALFLGSLYMKLDYVKAAPMTAISILAAITSLFLFVAFQIQRDKHNVSKACPQSVPCVAEKQS